MTAYLLGELIRRKAAPQVGFGEPRWLHASIQPVAYVRRRIFLLFKSDHYKVIWIETGRMIIIGNVLSRSGGSIFGAR